MADDVTAAYGPLDGLRVVSLAGHLPGPLATRLLADLGAEVTLVERREGDPLRTLPALHDALTRGCMSLAVDLRSTDGRAHVLERCAEADVVIEGFRPGVAARLGLGHADVRARNPDAVYVSISGFGATSPYADRASHDLLCQAVAGALHDQLGADADVADHRDRVPWADVAGSAFAVIGVLAGLYRRHTRGSAPAVDVSMADSLLALLGPLLVGGDPMADHQIVPPSPGYGLYRTADDIPVALGVVDEDRLWQALCHAVDRPDLADLPATARWVDAARLDAEIRAAVAAWPWRALALRLDAEGAPFARANRLDEVPDDPHVVASGTVERRGGTRLLRQPLRFDGRHPHVCDQPSPSLTPYPRRSRDPHDHV